MQKTPTRLRRAIEGQNPSDLIGWAVFAVVSLVVVVAMLVTAFVPVEKRATELAPFDIAALDGGRLQSAAMAGEPIVIWFWAPWCPVCHAVADDVAAVAREGSRVRIVGIAGDGEVEKMRQFVAQTGVAGIRHGIDVDGAMWKTFDITSVPTFAFRDADGSLDWHIGSMDRDDLSDRVAELAAY